MKYFMTSAKTGKGVNELKESIPLIMDENLRFEKQIEELKTSFREESEKSKKCLIQ